MHWYTYDILTHNFAMQEEKGLIHQYKNFEQSLTY